MTNTTTSTTQVTSTIQASPQPQNTNITNALANLILETVTKAAHACKCRPTVMEFDDMVSAGCIGAMKALNRLQGGVLQLGYIYAAAKNAIIDERRAYERQVRFIVYRPVSPSITDIYDDEQYVPDVPDPIDFRNSITTDNLWNYVHNTLPQHLTPAEQRFFNEYFQNDFSQEEIAKLFKLSPGRISQIKTSVVSKMKAVCINQFLPINKSQPSRRLRPIAKIKIGTTKKAVYSTYFTNTHLDLKKYRKPKKHHHSLALPQNASAPCSPGFDSVVTPTIPTPPTLQAVA